LVRAILHNPEDYPNPEVFDPERYLTSTGGFNPSVRNPRTACFGFGRRICPGQHVADASLFAMISTLLATVDIVRAKDAQGKEIIPEVDVTSGAISHPKPFPWSIRLRGTHAMEMLTAALAAN
jgi:cytochrome P450